MAEPTRPVIAGDWFERHPDANETVKAIPCPDCHWPLIIKAVAVRDRRLHMLMWCHRDREHFEYEERP